MKGLTNTLSQSTQTSGNIGDLVYAVNNTGANIVKNQKVWLNKHNLDESEAYQFKSGKSSTEFLISFDDSDNFIMFNANNGRPNYYETYNTETKSWNREELSPTSSINSGNFFRIISGIPIIHTSNSNGISNNTTIYSGEISRTFDKVYTGLYLGGGYRVYYQSVSVFVLESPGLYADPDGTATPILTELTGFNGYLTTACMLNGKLFVMDSEGTYKIYQVTTSGATLITSITNSIFSSNYPIQHFTGIASGEYVFYNTGKNQPNYEMSSLNILQFDDNYNLVDAQNLPEDLQKLIGQNAFVQYYNDTKILTVGTATNVYMFKYENGTFTNMNINISLPTESALHSSSAVYRLFISKDMTSAVITYRKKTTTGVTFDSGYYKLKTSSNDWYADTYPQFNSVTLTGFATGETDSQGRYEVMTVLPEILYLTLNITPDITDNDISFKGEANDY